MNDNILSEITEKLAKIEAIQKKEHRARIITLCSVILVLAVLAIIFVPKAMNAVESYRQISAKVREIQEDLDGVDLGAMAETVAALQPLAEKLGELNLEGIDFSGIDLSGLENAVEALKGIDFSSIQEKIDGFLESAGSWNIFGGLGGLFGT